MRVKALRIHGVRNLRKVSVEAGRLNWFYGDNGAGKTSILEALHLTGFGRTFREGGRLDWLNRENRQATVFCQTDQHRLGWEQSGRDFRARLDGEDIKTRSALAQRLFCLTFHPQSHELVQGGPEVRRRLLDYAVFHVEHTYINVASAYRRALSQRNAALRARLPDRMLEPWEQAMSVAAHTMLAQRTRVQSALDEGMRAGPWSEAPAGIGLSLHPGWDTDASLAEILAAHRRRDRDLGYTRDGPHRADLRLSDESGPISGRLSRGQQKMLALRLLVAVGDVVAARRQKPVFCLDDLTSELDAHHRSLVMEALVKKEWQLWFTAVEPPETGGLPGACVFHVEQGNVSKPIEV